MKKAPKAQTTYIAPTVTADPQLVALLHYILGEGGSGEYRDIIVANAITKARNIFTNFKSDTVVNDMGGGPWTFGAIMDGVQEWLAVPDLVSPKKYDTHKTLRRLMNSDLGEPTPLATDEMYSTLNECADSGMLFGAALMFGLLKGKAL